MLRASRCLLLKKVSLILRVEAFYDRLEYTLVKSFVTKRNFLFTISSKATIVLHRVVSFEELLAHYNRGIFLLM